MMKKEIEFTEKDIFYLCDEIHIQEKFNLWEEKLYLLSPKKCNLDGEEFNVTSIFYIYDSYGLLLTRDAFKKVNPERYKYFQCSFEIEDTDYSDLPSTLLRKDFFLTQSNMNSLMAGLNQIHNMKKLLEIEEIEDILNIPTLDKFKLNLSTVALFTDGYLKPEPGRFMPPMYKIKQIGALLEHKITYFVADSNEFGSQINHKCLIELFGYNKSFYSGSIQEVDNVDTLNGWQKLLIHLGVPFPSQTNINPLYYAKNRLRSLGVKFPENIF